MFEVLTIKLTKSLEKQAKQEGFDNVYSLQDPAILIIQPQNKEHLRKEISRAHSKKKKIIVLGSTDEMNRIALEDKRVSILLSPESDRPRDYMHSRNSGLNHVLCRLAVKNNIAIGISFDSVNSAKDLGKAEKMGRISQNILLCRKYKTEIILASFGKKPTNPYTLRSFGFALGMSTDQAKKSLESAKKFLK